MGRFERAPEASVSPLYTEGISSEGTTPHFSRCVAGQGAMRRNGGEIGRDSGCVFLRKQRAAQRGGMRADEEVGQDIALGSALTAILHERLCRASGRLHSRRNVGGHCNSSSVSCIVERSLGVEKRDRNLRIDDRVDRQIRSRRRLLAASDRRAPCVPDGSRSQMSRITFASSRIIGTSREGMPCIRRWSIPT